MKAEDLFQEYEKELESIAFPMGWSVKEMLISHRRDLDLETALRVRHILKEQAKLIRITHPHLSNVVVFPSSKY